jgi:hypothetical protein
VAGPYLTGVARAEGQDLVNGRRKVDLPVSADRCTRRGASREAHPQDLADVQDSASVRLLVARAREWAGEEPGWYRLRERPAGRNARDRNSVVDASNIPRRRKAP